MLKFENITIGEFEEELFIFFETIQSYIDNEILEYKDQKWDIWIYYYVLIFQFCILSKDMSKTIETDCKVLMDCFGMLYQNEKAFKNLSYIEAFAWYLIACSEMNIELAGMINYFQSERGLNTRNICIDTISEIYGLIFGEKNKNRNISILLSEDSTFVNFLADNTGGIFGALSLKKCVMTYLLGETMPLGEASSCVYNIDITEDDDLISNEVMLEHMLNTITRASLAEDDRIIFLKGINGIGKKFITGLCASFLDIKLLCLDVDKLISYDDITVKNYINRVLQKCFLEGMFLYLELGENSYSESSRLQRVISFIQNYNSLLFIGGNKPLPDNIKISGMLHLIEFDVPDKKTQKEFWSYFADKLNITFEQNIDLDEIVSTYNMTPQKIKNTLEVALPYCYKGEEGTVLNKNILQAQVRQICAVHFDQYATRLVSNFKWNDIELPAESKNLLMHAIDRVRYSSVVNEQFGFGKKLPYGKGTVVAFFGPPGTGKTMAANVMANELGMDIYRIDLSQIGSKYIGETEKNLAAVFEAAKYSNAILFFDEADALFGKRTDVSSSNDKHANAETAFLLQKIEEYSGVSILATNVLSNFDAAFKRRITYVIPINEPDENTRKELWEKVFPDEAPLDESFDAGFYATVALNGSNIKAAALSSAFRAAAEKRKITNHDIIMAIDEEYKKLGHTSIAGELMMGTYNL